MGGTQSSYAAKDWFENFGSGVGDFFGTVGGDFENIFKSILGTGSTLLSTGTSLLSSPIVLIGGGCLVLYIFVDGRSQVVQSGLQYASKNY